MLRLKELREDRDLTQKEVSKIINVPQVAYSYYEIGKRLINYYELSKLADFYGTSVDYILYRTDIRNPYPQGILKDELEKSERSFI